MAAAISIKAALLTPAIPLKLQLLSLAVLDNTASVDTHWASNRHAPWLSPERMLWYRRFYLPNEKDWSHWDASPLLAPQELLKNSPPTWIGVGELDILCKEDLAFGQRLEKSGIEVTTRIYKGSTHNTMSLDGKFLDESSGERY